MTCLQEDCAHWTGDGCACRVLDLSPTPTCRVCHRPIDTAHEHIEAGRCQDCHNDHQKEFAEWLAGGWSE